MNKPPENLVIVTVSGGVAETAWYPPGIDVRIVDYDNPPYDRDQEAEAWLDAIDHMFKETKK